MGWPDVVTTWVAYSSLGSIVSCMLHMCEAVDDMGWDE